MEKKTEVIIIRETWTESLVSDAGTFIMVAGLVGLQQWIVPDSFIAGFVVFFMLAIWFVFGVISMLRGSPRRTIDDAIIHLQKMKDAS